jgi:DinB family protein
VVPNLRLEVLQAGGTVVPETPQQYTQRILANIENENKEPLQVQQTTPKKLATLIRKLNKKQLTRRPAPGKWSIAEILAHLADTELVGGWRMRMILSHNGTPVQAFDQDAWANTFNYLQRDSKASLETFRVLRQNNLALLKSVPKNLWENYGMHKERQGKHSAYSPYVRRP